MRLKSKRVLAALVAAGAVAAFASAPVVPSVTASPAAAEEPSVSPDGLRALRRTPLTVRMGCSHEGDCNATASGGTGIYVSWDWYGAEEIYDEGGSYSFADANDCVPGSVMQVAARVTDSSRATAPGERFIFCPN